MNDASTHAGTGAAQDAPLLDSNYDGIREYDNPMPGWWTALFWVSILVSAPYFVYYHLGAGPTLADSYDAEFGAFIEAQAKTLGNLEPDETTILTQMSDPKRHRGAQVMFRANCAVCHGPEGGGKTGPNLTDNSYLNVKKVEDIYKVIHDGVVTKGMPEWGQRFGQAQLVLLASYVASLRGTHPAEAKPAQGDVIAPWPEVSQPEPPAATTAPTANAGEKG